MSANESTPEAIAARVRRYLQLVEQGATDEIIGLLADDVTIEDPVGNDVRVGIDAARELLASTQDLQRKVELHTLRVCGLEAAFTFTLTFDVEGNPMQLSPIDTMKFDSEGKITSLRSFFTLADIVPA